MAARVLIARVRTHLLSFKSENSFHSSAFLWTRVVPSGKDGNDTEDDQSSFFPKLREEKIYQENSFDPQTRNVFNFEHSRGNEGPKSYNDFENNRFQRNDRSFQRNDRTFQRNDRSFQRNDRSFQRRERNNKWDGDDEFSRYSNSVDSPAHDPDLQKNVYKEHEAVTMRTIEEVQDFHQANNVTVKGKDVPKPILSFDELDIADKLKDLVERMKWDKPFPIQSLTWPIAMCGRDVVGIAQTGSGKTLGYILPAIVHILKQPKTKKMYSPTVLVMAPTRELAQQIDSVVQTFGRPFGISSGLAYGGAGRQDQLRRLRGAQICIATPGRLNDFLQQGNVNLGNCSFLVLDEADRMLDMGFEVQIKSILRYIKPNRQTLMWSATWPRDVRKLATSYLDDYIQICVGSEDLRPNPNITQKFIVSAYHSKFDKLCQLLKDIATEDMAKCKSLIFVNTKRVADDLQWQLQQKGIPCFAIHGDKSQNDRDFVLNKFRTGKKVVMIATNVAARGIDVTDIANVINFDLPTSCDEYIHRIGRTARGSEQGRAYSFIDGTEDLLSELVQILRNNDQEVPSELEQHGSRKRSNNRPRSRTFSNRRPMFVDPAWKD